MVKVKQDRFFKTYGVTDTQRELMLSEQNGVCAICKTLPTSGILCIDHIHQKGFKTMLPVQKIKYVRGLLCYMCNVAIKGFDKTVDGQRNRQRLEGTYEYFKRYGLKGEL